MNIKDSGPPISDARVAELESRVGKRFPETYRQFLLASNGGRPIPDTVTVKGLPGGATDVQVFFGVEDPIDSCTIGWNLNVLSKRLEQLAHHGMSLLPIAIDSGGSVFLLSIGGRANGAVFYADLQSVFADYEAIPRLYLVAPAFEDFLDGLAPYSE